MHDMFRLATPSADGVQWLLRRNCSVTPRQLLLLFLSLSGLSLGVAAFFWSRGATLVLPFTVVELVAVGGAFLVYARHATDQERICCVQGALVIEQERAGRTWRSEFARHVVSVGGPIDGSQLVEVRGGGQTVHVGRHLRADLRPVLARELRVALRL